MTRSYLALDTRRNSAMFFATQNFVRIAVDRIGGPTKTAHALAVSNATVHAWITKQTITNIDKAKLMAKLSGLDVQQLRNAL
jgi:DNA-binding transcriptional regulator YdaS (Cro superfamily)